MTSKEFLQKVAQLIKDVMEYQPADQLNHIMFLRFAMKDLFYYHDTKDWLCCLLVNVGGPDKYQFWLKGVDNGNN